MRAELHKNALRPGVIHLGDRRLRKPNSGKKKSKTGDMLNTRRLNAPKYGIQQVSPLIQKSKATGLAPHLREVSALSRDELLGIATARGCQHYAPFVAPEFVSDRPGLSHEVLGCALLRGPADLETFQSIRVGTMVLSDEACSPELVTVAAEALGVESRLAHIADTALAAGDRPEYWREILNRLPVSLKNDEADFLPGASRFRLETGKRGPGLGAARVWLRTHYAQ